MVPPCSVNEPPAAPCTTKSPPIMFRVPEWLAALPLICRLTALASVMVPVLLNAACTVAGVVLPPVLTLNTPLLVSEAAVNWPVRLSVPAFCNVPAVAIMSVLSVPPALIVNCCVVKVPVVDTAAPD